MRWTKASKDVQQANMLPHKAAAAPLLAAAAVVHLNHAVHHAVRHYAHSCCS
jgi:hypothetical protein